MGEVWRARDTRLDRRVAIKILPEGLSSNAQSKLRFEREAKLVSQLNHPHICALYDVGEGFLVMELVEGESLADRLQRGAMSIDEVLRYGAQIADALDRAHRAGIVHRDLKPGNIMITKSGAKLLDFGLAKAAFEAAPPEHATAVKPLTEEGTIVGTFQYMAPEQLEGAEADARTDLFALGAVLYEMATGRRAFEGKTKTSLIAAIVAGEPKPLSELQPLTPPALEHVVAKCLSKDPEDRWQSAHDVAEELRWVSAAGSRAGAPAASLIRKKSRERLAWMAALLAAIAVMAWLALRPRPRLNIIEAEIGPGESKGLQYQSGPPALSPDGTNLVYASEGPSRRRMLWLRSLDRGVTRMLAGTEDAVSPVWSPDGRFIAFRVSGGDLKKIAVAEGEPELIVSRTSGGIAWNRDDVILFVQHGGTIQRVRASGGDSALVLSPKTIGCDVLWWPAFLPDGNHFLVLAVGGEAEKRGQAGIWVATLDQSEKPRFLVRADSNAQYAAPGYLLYGAAGALRAQPFDAKRARVTGEAATIGPVQSYAGVAHFTASDSGVLIYQPGGNAAPRSELVIRNRKGEPIRKIGEPAFYFTPRVSPDGRHVAVDISNPVARGDIWILDTAGDSRVRLTFEQSNETLPVWSRAGDEIVYVVNRTMAGVTIIRKRLGGTGQTVYDEPAASHVPSDWSPDGRFLAVSDFTTENKDVLVWSMADRKWIPIATSPALESVPVFSPDGKWIAYQSDESGRREIYVQPFPTTGEKYQVSTGGGVIVRWRRSGEMFWVDPERRLNVAAVTTEPAFRVGPASVLFPIDQREYAWGQYDILPDGTILTNSYVEQRRPMTMVVNWWRRFEK